MASQLQLFIDEIAEKKSRLKELNREIKDTLRQSHRWQDADAAVREMNKARRQAKMDALEGTGLDEQAKELRDSIKDIRECAAMEAVKLTQEGTGIPQLTTKNGAQVEVILSATFAVVP
jgi:predicted  nucleic acid-binding Zn-ribbon protein